MKILLVIPKVKSLFGDENAIPGHPHVGIAYLAAVLKNNDHDVKIFDEGIEGRRNGLFESADSFNPNLIGVTAFSYCYQYAYNIVTELKTKTNYPVVVGGSHASAVTKEILRGTRADFVIKGEGEITLLELINEIQNSNQNFAKVDGLIWRNQDGEIVENKNRDFIQNLDSLPLPNYEVFEIRKYPYYSERTLPIITSRGCPYKCSFCSVRLSMGKKFRARSPEGVVDEIEYWYKRGWNSFEINDDCFTLDMNRAMKICDLLIERELKITYQLYNGIRPDRATPALLQKMKKSGCVFVSYGCEAGNNQILKNIKKGFTLEQVQQAVKWTNEVGIKNSVNFIIGHPGETQQTARDSIQFAKSLPTNFVNFYNLVPYPGTELFDWVKQNATFLIPMDVYLKDISYRDSSPLFETKKFTGEERKQMLERGFALYEKTILQFRLGKKWSYLAYVLARVRPLAKIGRNFALYNRFGRKLYMMISSTSRSKLNK